MFGRLEEGCSWYLGESRYGRSCGLIWNGRVALTVACDVEWYLMLGLRVRKSMVAQSCTMAVAESDVDANAGENGSSAL